MGAAVSLEEASSCGENSKTFIICKTYGAAVSLEDATKEDIYMEWPIPPLPADVGETTSKATIYLENFSSYGKSSRLFILVK
jgi:hypothetical protein